MDRNERMLESICLEMEYDQDASFGRVKHGVAIFFFDCAVYIGDYGVCVKELEDQVYLSSSELDFIPRLLNYRKSGGKKSIKDLKLKHSIQNGL